MRQDSFNLTAYRILKILLWLEQEPLTLDTINARFDADPLIDKTLSQDSIGLYLNTLKAIGCEISRPTSTNGYHYELKFHPFSYELTPELIVFFQTLLHTLTTLGVSQISFEDYLNFHKWLARIIEYSSNTDKAKLTEDIFGASLPLPLNTLVKMVAELQKAIDEKQVLDVTYLSTTQGRSQKIFLPVYFHHSRGLFYVIGCSPNNNEAVMLRLERILDYNASRQFKGPAEGMLQQYEMNKTYIIRFLNALPEHYHMFNNSDEVLTDPTNNEHLIVKLEADSTFNLQQHIIKQGFPFQVLYPDSWRSDVLEDLRAMQGVYAA